MGFQDKISHAALVTKWKADQQVRIFRVQGQVGDLENKVRTQKYSLADMALSLFSRGVLTEKELIQICQAIAETNTLINEQKTVLETIKNEQPPTNAANVQTAVYSGLVCPECGDQLVGKFCSKHGVEGVLPAPVAVEPVVLPNSTEPSATTTTTAKLMCPICKKPLNVRFCPEHGVEGVLVNN